MPQDGKTMFRTGCMGCLGVAGVLALAFAAMMIVAWVQVGGAKPTSAELAQQPADTGPVRVYLDIKDADVTVGRGPAGSSLRVEATFDPRYFDLEQKPTDDGTWHVWFRRVRGSGKFMHYLHQLVGAKQAEIHVELPPDATLTLRGNFEAGLVRIDLAGLQVSEFVTELASSAFVLEVSEPIPPMEHFGVDARQSQLKIIDLGNASPRSVEIDMQMGHAEIGLEGPWRRDAEIDIEASMTSGVVRLPQVVNVEGLPTDAPVVRSEEVPRPTLRFVSDTGVSGIRFEAQ